MQPAENDLTSFGRIGVRVLVRGNRGSLCGDLHWKSLLSERFTMKIRPVIILLSLMAFLGSCSTLMDGKFTGKEGKESPFRPPDDSHKPPSDPTSPFSF
jgi:hypothetical protein